MCFPHLTHRFLFNSSLIFCLWSFKCICVLFFSKPNLVSCIHTLVLEAWPAGAARYSEPSCSVLIPTHWVLMQWGLLFQGFQYGGGVVYISVLEKSLGFGSFSKNNWWKYTYWYVIAAQPSLRKKWFQKTCPVFVVLYSLVMFTSILITASEQRASVFRWRKGRTQD